MHLNPDKFQAMVVKGNSQMIGTYPLNILMTK